MGLIGPITYIISPPYSLILFLTSSTVDADRRPERICRWWLEDATSTKQLRIFLGADRLLGSLRHRENSLSSDEDSHLPEILSSAIAPNSPRWSEIVESERNRWVLRRKQSRRGGWLAKFYSRCYHLEISLSTKTIEASSRPTRISSFSTALDRFLLIIAPAAGCTPSDSTMDSLQLSVSISSRVVISPISRGISSRSLQNNTANLLRRGKLGSKCDFCGNLPLTLRFQGSIDCIVRMGNLMNSKLQGTLSEPVTPSLAFSHKIMEFTSFDITIKLPFCNNYKISVNQIHQLCSSFRQGKEWTSPCGFAYKATSLRRLVSKILLLVLSSGKKNFKSYQALMLQISSITIKYRLPIRLYGVLVDFNQMLVKLSSKLIIPGFFKAFLNTDGCQNLN
ncbi:hypothetical protein Ccrd_017623 [Cynara cardunculus var. scolymus]|uniref:Uncharacterized protein n=1 Tax=Cynara cardunculus var. scolymus TaxID=59895 RepID=A0A124SFR5_CYNCS|nr:hypothetical protein Ccrd_017623 [Cynara cardunculus var. scolymus]